MNTIEIKTPIVGEEAKKLVEKCPKGVFKIKSKLSIISLLYFML